MTEAAHTEQPTQQKGTDNKVLRGLANIVSYLLHPMFMPLVMTYVLYILSPVTFAQYEDAKSVIGNGVVPVFIQIGVTTIMYPLLVVLILKGLGMIESVQMRTRKERIIPLIASMVFYWWVSHVFKSHEAPVILQTVLRGAYWGLILVFLASIFFKVSMHTAAAGGMLGILVLLLFTSPVAMSVPLFIGIVIAGVIGTARLLLGAHTPFEVWVGYAIGFVAQFAAYWWILW